MIHRLGVPRASVDVQCVQPLPWQAREVFVSFGGGPAYTCQPTRHPGDLIRVELGDLEVPAGTQAEIQWTQDFRGSYASGTVVTAPAGEPAGIYVRIDESVSGIERRLDTRVKTRVPVRLTDTSGRPLRGHTLDLSPGGAHVIAEPSEATPSGVPFALGDRITTELVLPDGAVQAQCLVSGTGAEPGDVRLRFLDPDSGITAQLVAYLRTTQPDV
jgi:hypothetical protein